MISNILPSAVGNAIQVWLQPIASAVRWVLLRNMTGVFTGPSDPSATLIYSGSDLTFIVDIESLTNGTPYYYGIFYFDGTNWTAGAVASATPNSTYVDQAVDVLSVVRDRLDYGLQNEITIGALTPESGVIQVLNAPPIFEETNFPVVTVHVTSDGSGDRAVGEIIFPDEFDPAAGLWDESEGWLARVHLTIVGWSKNPDERIALRKALRKIVIGNLGVFDSVGMETVEFSQQDVDELSAYPAPIYQSMCSFSCEAPAGVSAAVGPINEIAPTTITTVF